MVFRYDLTRLKTKAHLLEYLSIEEYWFDEALNFDVEAYLKLESRVEEASLLTIPTFIRHSIPKKNIARGYRTVWTVRGPLTDAYRAASRRLTNFFEYALPGFPHACCYGYVRGRNIRQNAAAHIGATQILKTDIRDFFPSITDERLQTFFVTLGVQSDIATLLSGFLTIGGGLPLGLSPSPIVANAVCHQLDFDLEKIAQTAGCTYSRYADDLTFSTTEGNLPGIVDVGIAVQAYGFMLANDKTRYIKRGQNFYVTGLSISDPKAPHAPRKMKRELRQELYFSQKHGLSGHLERLGLVDDPHRQIYINYLDGRVKYIAFHEPRIAANLITIWQKILEESGDQASFEPKNQSRVGFDFFVDETEFKLNGNPYLALGMSASQHQGQLNEATINIYESFLANPLADGKLEELEKNGLHFYDATEDLKKEYITALSKLPFNAYVVFGAIPDPADYEKVYLGLLQAIIKRRLMAAESLFAHFYFEATTKVSQEAIKNLIEQAWKDLIKSRNRHPKHAFTSFVGKESAGVCVPDFVLGVFRRYVESGPPTNPPSRPHILYEHIRDKIRVVTNADTGEEFTRRNPLMK